MAANIYMIARPASGGTALINQTLDPLFKSWNTTELMSFSLSSQNPTTIGSATGGAGTGKITFSPLTITKQTDSNSPTFLKYCATGAHFDRVTLYVTKPSAAGIETVAEIYVLGLVYVSGISNDVTSGDDVVTETITLVYGQLERRVKAYSSTGTLTGTVISNWDVTLNTSWSPGILDGPG